MLFRNTSPVRGQRVFIHRGGVLQGERAPFRDEIELDSVATAPGAAFTHLDTAGVDLLLSLSASEITLRVGCTQCLDADD